MTRDFMFFNLSIFIIRELCGTAQPSFASRPSCSSSADELPEDSQETERKASSLFHTQKKDFSEKESSLSMLQNQFPPPPPPLTGIRAETSTDIYYLPS